MTVSDTDTKQIYQGDGGTTTFAIPFEFEDSTQIRVVLRDETDTTAITETVQTLTTHYTLTGGPPVTNVEMVTAPTATQKLLVTRLSLFSQLLNHLASGVFPAESHEAALDRIVQLLQELDERADRSAVWPETSPSTLDNTLPEPVADAFLTVAPSGLGWAFASQDSVSLGGRKKVTIANNQAAAASVTGVLFDKTIIKAASIFVDIERRTNSDDLEESGFIFVRHNTETDGWKITLGSYFEDAGVTFTITSAGQLQYTSTNMGGASYRGTIRTFNVKELIQ